MKVCLINNLYKPYNRGGAERVVEGMAENYAKAGDEVIIIATRPYFHEISDSKKNAKIYHVPSFYYDLLKIPLVLRLFWHLWDMFDFASCLRVRKILEREKPGLVITHNLKGVSFLVPALLRKMNLRHWHYLHDIQLIYPSGLLYYGEENRLDGIMARAYQWIGARLFGSPDKVISPTGWLMELHAGRGFFKNSKHEIRLPDCGARKAGSGQRNEEKDGAKAGKEAELRLKNAKSGKPFRFLFVGQLEKHKGAGILIEAFGRLLSGPELVIAGEGSFSGQLREEAVANSRISFLGGKNRGEVAEIMSRSDCLIVPSLCYENAPAVICEAALAGLPVIASRIGGIPELMEKYGGYLFTPGDAEELAEKMKKALAG